MSEPPRGWIAGVLSLIVPGTGQLYVGQPARGLLVFIFSIIASTIASYLMLLVPATAGVIAAGLISLGWNLLAASDAVDIAVRWPPERVRGVSSRGPVVFIAFALALAILSVLAHNRAQNLVSSFNIPTSSMAPEVVPGDRIVADLRPSAREPRRGALMVYTMPADNGARVLKRVLGLPGDTLEMEEGRLRIDGRLVAEPYLAPKGVLAPLDSATSRTLREWVRAHRAGLPDPTALVTLNTWGPVVVPRDSVFVLGDNRDDSYDGRYFGFLATRSLRGTALYIWSSKDSLGRPRRGRYGTLLH